MYLGTPAAAVPTLSALHDAGYEISLVVTGGDRRRGRRSAPTASPVKEAAQRLGLPVSHDLASVAGCGAQLGVVVAYGRLIPEDLLAEVPMVNLHFSLLPRWRGAAPVERAILAGDAVAGVCVMAVEVGLDTGGVYARSEVPVGHAETIGPAHLFKFIGNGWRHDDVATDDRYRFADRSPAYRPGVHRQYDFFSPYQCFGGLHDRGVRQAQ